ncbi:MAG: 4-hydroxy-3-methylbut-2-enyl diphosphate reductase [Candidatus Omnitrophica bacterium]|nr:4-hydroxy-3-methylbut-2-enyl diphosphate reductase [Candidatus Omnitrophota bacterium]
MKKLIIAKNIGFCFGVKRAVETSEKLLEKIPSLDTVGDIVHNPLVMEKLKSKNLNVCNSIKEIKGKYFLIRTHGLSRKEIEELKNRKIKIFDMTCPFVKKIHYLVENLNKKGYHIIIIGNKNHPEVLGIKGYGEKINIIEKEKDIFYCKKNKMEKIAIIGQTTLNFSFFLRFIEIILKKIKAKEVLIYNTICKVTEEREEEGKEISKKVECVLTLGGKESSNTKKLFEICKKICENTFYIEKISDLSKINFKKFKSIGIISGTSTPNFFIKEVIEYLKKI